jgi:hypothetical protein
LEPVRKDANGKTTFVMYPGTIRENPWIGSQQPTVAIIRQTIEGQPREYENLTGAIAGYAAQYLADDGGKVWVYAVRFTDPSLTMLASAKRLNGETPRIVFGRVAANIGFSRPTTRVKGTAATDGCYEAVRKYVGTLK